MSDGVIKLKLPETPRNLEDKTFLEFSTLLKRLAGINLPLNEKNITLVESRLSKLLRKYNLTDYNLFLERLRAGGQEITTEFVQVLTTNTTQFFREPQHFEIMKDLIPKLRQHHLATGTTDFRVWCAAASTGQEPYSILITLLEALPELPPTSIKMLATDINTTVLRRGAEGIYTNQEVNGVPPLILSKYFSHNNYGYQVKDSFRNLIRFAPFNLIQEPYPFEHPFDIIFCRNVFIYFDRDTTSSILHRLVRAMRQGGYLFIGHAETIATSIPSLKTVAHTVYKKL